MNQYIFGLFVLLVVGFAIYYLYLILRHREKANVLNFASYVGLGISFFFVIHLIMLMVYPVKVQETELPLKVENTEVRRGEYLRLQVHIRKYVDKESAVSPAIICDNGYYYVYPNVTSNMPMGEQTFTVANIYLIPLDAPLGKCIVRATDHFQLNIFRGINFIQESEDFTIIE